MLPREVGSSLFYIINSSRFIKHAVNNMLQEMESYCENEAWYSDPICVSQKPIFLRVISHAIPGRSWMLTMIKDATNDTIFGR